MLKPVDNEKRLDRLTTVVLALLPTLLAVLTMGLIAWVMFF
ncbi:hypothetical protein [Halorussus sp. MSC15.2]|nr:hypothetical protein [Halorussus sp. MSC15.2]